ncbi:MAG: hypothetical protein ACREC3_03795 [Methyloceanibacter sp.]|jgi:hypothetical protein
MRVIPEAGLPEILDFAGKPSYPESRATGAGASGPWIPDRKARESEPFGFALA